jgi:hypothetical protein
MCLLGEVLESKMVEHMRTGEYEPMELMISINRSRFGDLYAVSGRVEGQCGETLWIDSTSDYERCRSFFEEAERL